MLRLAPLSGLTHVYLVGLSSLVSLAAGAGCSQPANDPATDVTASEVRTRSCPTSFALGVSGVTPTPIPNQAQVGDAPVDLSPRDRDALAAIQSKFVAAGTIQVAAELASAENGVCRYRQPSSSLSGNTIKLYTKGGKDILEMTVDVEHRPFVDDFRVYAFPASYSPSGFTFETNAEALLDGVLGIADGPNLVVKVGTARIGAGGAPATPATSLASDPKLIAGLEALGQAASFGASLEYFGYEENAAVPTTGCNAATAAQAAAAFAEIVDTVVEAGDLGEAPELTNKETVADLKARFATLLGSHDYRICHSTVSGGMSFGSITTIAADAPGTLSVAFELGWED
jgi:hypothetical protein